MGAVVGAASEHALVVHGGNAVDDDGDGHDGGGGTG